MNNNNNNNTTTYKVPQHVHKVTTRNESWTCDYST